MTTSRIFVQDFLQFIRKFEFKFKFSLFTVIQNKVHK